MLADIAISTNNGLTVIADPSGALVLAWVVAMLLIAFYLLGIVIGRGRA